MQTYIINIYGIDLHTPFSYHHKFAAESYNEAVHKAKSMVDACWQKMQPKHVQYDVLTIDSMLDATIFDRDFA